MIFSILYWSHFLLRALLFQGSFSVLGGSSHIEADINDTKVAFVLEQPHAPDYLHMTIAARGLGTALITVYDVGLISPAFDSAMVFVSFTLSLKYII